MAAIRELKARNRKRAIDSGHATNPKPRREEPDDRITFEPLAAGRPLASRLLASHFSYVSVSSFIQMAFLRYALPCFLFHLSVVHVEGVSQVLEVFALAIGYVQEVEQVLLV